jgi:hypothetical protein
VQSDTCITKYKDSKSEEEENVSNSILGKYGTSAKLGKNLKSLNSGPSDSSAAVRDEGDVNFEWGTDVLGLMGLTGKPAAANNARASVNAAGKFTDAGNGNALGSLDGAKFAVDGAVVVVTSCWSEPAAAVPALRIETLVAVSARLPLWGTEEDFGLLGSIAVGDRDRAGSLGNGGGALGSSKGLY